MFYHAPDRRLVLMLCPLWCQVLAINLDPNSQTAIFEAVALGLPLQRLASGAPAFDVHVFTTSAAALLPRGSDTGSGPGRGLSPSPSDGEEATVARLLAGLVPLHAVRLFGHGGGDGKGLGAGNWSAGAIATALRGTRVAADLVAESPEQAGVWASAPPGLRAELFALAVELARFHVATAANSRGVPETSVLLECARLAGTLAGTLAAGASASDAYGAEAGRQGRQGGVSSGPRVVLELPNLWPSVVDLAGSVDAVVGPSASALAHPSVRPYGTGWTYAANLHAQGLSLSHSYSGQMFPLWFN